MVAAAVAAATTGTPTKLPTFPIKLPQRLGGRSLGAQDQHAHSRLRDDLDGWHPRRNLPYRHYAGGHARPAALASGCYTYKLTGTDNALYVQTVTTIVKYHVTAPTAGALTVNGTVASGAGIDTISVSSSVCTLNFGAPSLGATGYTSSTVSFAGARTDKCTVDWIWSGQQTDHHPGTGLGSRPCHGGHKQSRHTHPPPLCSTSAVSQPAAPA